MIVTAGSANVSAYFYIVGDSSHASPGDPVTGLAFGDIETGGEASYLRQGGLRVDAGTVITQTVDGAHSDGGFVEVSAADMPGVYRFDYPDAAFLTGVGHVYLQLVVAAANNAVAAPISVMIFDLDVRDAVRGGLTALPNATAGSAGGLADDTDANGRTRVVSGTGAGEISLASGLVDLTTDAVDSTSLAANAITDVWNKQVESEGTYTAQQVMSIILSVLAGETNTGGTIFRTPNDVATRVTATVDGSNNRTTMVLTPSS